MASQLAQARLSSLPKSSWNVRRGARQQQQNSQAIQGATRSHRESTKVSGSTHINSPLTKFISLLSLRLTVSRKQSALKPLYWR